MPNSPNQVPIVVHQKRGECLLCLWSGKSQASSAEAVNAGAWHVFRRHRGEWDMMFPGGAEPIGTEPVSS